jgi:23S rRNA pseudouridine2604 synthase
MSELGLASRREADEWIERGLVRVDGVIVDQLGARVLPTQRIEVDPEAHKEQSQRVTILLHKPLGIVSGQAEDGHAPAATLVNAESRWPGDQHPRKFHPSQLHHLVPAGRLDLDSTGLLVLTQDGRIAKQLIGADTKVEKEYVVHVAWPEQPDAAKLNEVFPADKLALLREGMLLDRQALKPAKVSWQNETHLRFVLREGKRRQIRRMCEEVGLQVLGLKRIRIGRVGLGEMGPGQWRYLGAFETFL